MTQDRWNRVKEVLQKAFECDPQERAAYLDRTCGADAELRSRVEELLVCDQQLGDFLATPLSSLGAGEGFVDTDEPVEGRLIGPYRILREIGRGGMGVVYLAERADGQYRKQVAIKLISSGLAGESVLRRFRNERQVLATLEHPNIARLIDGGVTGDGSLYFAMEYVDGIRVDAWCDSRKLSVPERLRLFQQVCDAVQSAHHRQVIHRDIKPANILVTAEGTPKLLDFGIAKVLNSEFATDPQEATVGPGPMTPAYASPEQVRGEPIGTAVDIFALGVVLYQLLTGHLPPSGCLKGDLDSIVRKALSQEPHMRYASVSDFSEDLERYLADQPVRARKKSLRYHGGKFLKRNRRVVTAGVAGAFLVLALIAGVNRFRTTGGAVQAIAVLPLENLSGDREQDYFVDGLTDALIDNLSRIRDLRVISRTSVMSYKGRRSLPDIARDLGVPTIVEGSVLRSGSHLRIAIRLVNASKDRPIWSGSYEGELQDAPALQSKVSEAIADEIHVSLTAPDRGARNRRVNLDAYDAYLKGRNQYTTEFTQGSMEKAIASFQRALTFDLGYAPAYAGLADCYYMLSSIYYPPTEVMPRAKGAALKAIELDDRLAEAHATLALVRSVYEFQRADAERGFKRALELKPSNAQAHLWYGLHLAGMSRFDQALLEVQQAQKLDPVSPAMNAYIGAALYFAHRYDELIERLRPIAEVHPDHNQPHAFLALAYEQKGESAKAIAEMEQAWRLDQDQDGMAQLGHIYAVSGRTEDARKLLRELQELSRKRYVSAYNIGVLYLGLGDREEAFRWFQKVEQDRSEWFAMINVDPRLDGIHSDPRFSALLRSVGLAR